MELVPSISTLFLGTSTGKLICFPWPNKPVNIMSVLPTVQAHNTRVKKIRLSSDMFYLISISEESLYIHNFSLIKEMRRIDKYELQR